MSDSKAELERMRDRALQDEKVDGHRADQAYARKNTRRGQFFVQEARRDFLLAQIYQRRIDAMTQGAR